MTRNTVHLAAAAIAVITSHNAVAQTAPDQGDASTIIVTALRVPVEESRVSSSVTVLDSVAIERAQPLALTDILATTPGISVARNGGYGQVTSLRIRGASPGQSVVVIDGMRMADPTATDGGFDFSQLFTDDIARVEILRGPQAILWGSNAIGGIINVTTVAPVKPLEMNLSVEGGSHQTANAHAGIGGTSALLDWRVSASTFTTDGIPTLQGGTQANGYTRHAASGTTTFHLASNVSLDLRGYWDSARNSFSDTYSLPSGAIYAGDYAQTRQWSGYAGLNIALADGRFKNRFAVLQNQTDNADYTPVNVLYGSPALTFISHGRTRRYEYQGSFAPIKAIDLVFGAERAEQRMATGSPYDVPDPFDLTPHTAATNSVYGEARVTPLTGLTLNGGVRYDHQSQFSGSTVFSAGAVYTPDHGTTVVRASYDEGFKAPSLYQQFSEYGATGLQPERARGWEVGAARALFGDAVQLGAVWWQRHTRNLIDFAYCPFDGPLPAICYIPGTAISRFGYYANLEAANGRGLELTASAHAGHAFAHGNYSIVVNEDRTAGSATIGQQLPRVPRHSANGEAGYDLPHGVSTSVAVRWSGASFDSAFSNLVLRSYTLVDWRVEWKLAPALTLFGRVENVGDRQYVTANGYNSLGRTGYLGLRGHF